MKFPIDLTSGIIVVRATVTGRGDATLYLAFDTDAENTTIPVNVAHRIGFDLSPVDHLGVISSTGRIEVPVVILKSLSTLGQTVYDLPVLCHDLPAQIGFDGVLGLDFVSRFDVRLNFPKNYMELTSVNL